ncbi:MAG TPA: DUF3343 domain-containing protein [Syntrophomonadaceae bacterium]|nr:DUF3343 domain-containing protein [Syntrophomonadaceae bacterium]
MKNGLIELSHFALFTFATTSQALKAEKVLQAIQAEFLVIPTLREISASCGLSIKFRLEDGLQFYDLLLNNKIQIDGIYQVQKNQGSYSLKELEKF